MHSKTLRTLVSFNPRKKRESDPNSAEVAEAEAESEAEAAAEAEGDSAVKEGTRR